MNLINIQFPPIAGILLGIAMGLGASIPEEEGVRKAILYAFATIVVAVIGGGIYSYNPIQLEILFHFFISFLVSFIVSFLIGLRYRRWRHGVPVAVVDFQI